MTMDEENPRATAFAIKDGEITGVGSDADMRALMGPKTVVVNLEGRGVTPGLVDGHAHLYGLGTAVESVSLKGIASEEEAAAAVAKAAASQPGEWVTGRGWDQNLWSPQAFPNRATLDAVVADQPVAVRRVDGHALWANSKALALAGVTADTPDPAGGVIVRDDAGAPTGVFVDNAMDLIESAIPAPTAEVRRRRILRAAEMAVAVGLTGVHEMGISDETVAVYQALDAEGALPLRIYALLSYSDEVLESLSTRHRIQGKYFSMRGMKVYADGALGSRGASLLAPYADAPDTSGLVITSVEDMATIAKAAAAHGWQLAVHAIGDRANRAVLDAFAAAQAEYPEADLRFRVEHAQILAPADIPRFAAQKVIASMQPTHCTSDMPWAEARVGPERIAGAYAWRSVLDTGGRILAGSDFPIEDVSPLFGVYAAVTRQDHAGKPEGGWYPDQRMTLDEAIAAFTVEPAYASFSETSRGRLAPGFAADVTIYDRALAADRQLLETGVEITLVAGQPVYSSEWAREKLASGACGSVR